MPFQRGNPGRPATDPAERFWSKVDRSGGPDACWPYTGALVWDGYGRFRLTDRTVRAHRYAYELTHGPTRSPLDHLCRNRVCCNPSHLEPVTPEENRRRGAQYGRRRSTAYVRPLSR